METVINSIISQVPPTSGDDLLGFEMDCGALFDDEKFRSVEVVTSKSPESIFNIEIQIEKSIDSIQELTEIIRNLYQKIEYNEFSMHGTKWLKENLEFRFLTMPRNNSYFVTGTVKVTGKEYEDLYRRYEKEFAGVIRMQESN